MQALRTARIVLAQQPATARHIAGSAIRRDALAEVPAAIPASRRSDKHTNHPTWVEPVRCPKPWLISAAEFSSNLARHEAEGSGRDVVGQGPHDAPSAEALEQREEVLPIDRGPGFARRHS